MAFFAPVSFKPYTTFVYCYTNVVTILIAVFIFKVNFADKLGKNF